MPAASKRVRIGRVLAYVEKKLHLRITLAELADVAALSHYHFCRAFKAAKGMAPMHYVWSRRVERAKLLLKTTNKSLATVSVACGFCCQSHFTTRFRQATGMTPAAYRASIADRQADYDGH